MGFGQLVIGPPGSGKTTYCNGIQHFFQLTGRPCAVINLDPANHDPPYECAVSVEELITLEEAQREFNLGPNGAMVYCIEYVSKNLDWLKERVTPSWPRASTCSSTSRARLSSSTCTMP